MRVVSLNCWGGQLYDALLPYLAQVEADVFCLQEVLRSPDRTGGWYVYSDGPVTLQQRPDLFHEIAAVLPDHDGMFFPTSRGELSSDDGALSSEFGIATFVRKGLPVIGQVMDFVHGRYSSDGFGAHPRPRNAHCLRLFDHMTGHPVTIAHLHGLRTEHGKGDGPERRAQAEKLIDLVRRVWPVDERLIVCGDLNLLPGSETFAMLGELGLADLVTSRGFTDTRTSFYRKTERFADYMLATPQLSIQSFDVVRSPEVSDHCPLLLEFD